MENNPHFIIIIMSLLCWAVLVGIFISIHLRKSSFLKKGRRTTGLLKDFIYDDNNGKNSIQYPVVEFKTFTGEIIEEKGIFGINEQIYELNATVSVVYQPDDPSKYCIDEPPNETKLYLFIAGFTIMELVLLFLILRL